MLLNKNLVQVSTLTDANNKELIKTTVVNVQGNTLTLPSSSKQLSISPPIGSIDSNSMKCEDDNDNTVPTNGSTNILIKCRSEVSTENQELKVTTVSYGGETRNTGIEKQSRESDVITMTTSVNDITVNDVDYSVTAVHLIMLYHMIWCIQMGIVENPPLWPYADQYRTCRSPIVNAQSEVMIFIPPLIWFDQHKNIQVSVTESFLSHVVWCAKYEFKLEQILFVSFHNILTLCKKTKAFAENYSLIDNWPNRPRTLLVKLNPIVLYHFIWCVQNESLPFRGLPMYSRELMSCQSPLNPFNNETIQSTNLKWWGTPEALGMTLNIVSSTLMELFKCAKRKMFEPDDMIHPVSILSACRKIDSRRIAFVSSEQLTNARADRNNRERMLKPIYICLGVIVLLFGSLGNLITCVISLRKKMRQTSSGLYLSSLAIIDTLFLYIQIVPQIVIFLKGNIVLVDIFICKTLPFFVNYIDYLSAWLRLCFTIERTVAVTLPYIYRVYFSRRITVFILLACCVILAVTTSPIIFFSTSNGDYCKYKNIKWRYVLSWIDIVVSTIVPFTGIILSNSILIYSLCKARRQRQHLTDSQVDIHMITVMCIATSFSFVLSTAPIRAYLISNNSYLYDSVPVINLRSPVRYDVKVLLGSFRYINSSVNFLLYCISGSVFRQELLKLFKKTNQVALVDIERENSKERRGETMTTTSLPI